MELFLLTGTAVAMMPVLMASQRRGPVAYLSLAFFASFVTIHVVAPIIAPQSMFNDRVLQSQTGAATLVLSSALGFAVCYTMPYREFFQGRTRSAPGPTGQDRPRFNISYQSLILAVGVALAGLVIFAIGRSGSVTGFVSSARFAGRGSGIVALEVAGRFLGRMAPIAVVLGMMTPSASKRRFSLLAALALAGFYFLFLKGTRAEPIAIVGAAIVGFAAGRPNFLKMSRRTKVGLAVGVLLVAALTSALKDARHLDPNETRVEALGRALTDASKSPADLLGRDPLNYHAVLIGVVDNAKDIDAPLLGPIRRTIFAPLPTGFFDLKPVDTNILVGDALNSKVVNTTVPPTVPGEGLLALGESPLSPFLWAVMYALLLRLIERAAARSTVLRVTVLATTVELGLLATRGQLFESTVRFVSTLLLVWATLRLSNRRKRRQRPGGLSLRDPQPGSGGDSALRPRAENGTLAVR